MASERFNPGVLRDRMIEFIRSPQVAGNFVLEGPIDVPTFFETFVGIFLNTDPDFFVVGDAVDLPRFYSRILNLELPGRLKEIRYGNDIIIAARLFENVRGPYLPNRVLAFGTSRDTKEEVVLLVASRGIPPQDALDDIKERVRERLARLN